MRFKKLMVLMIILVTLLTVSAVAAAENGTDDVITADVVSEDADLVSIENQNVNQKNNDNLLTESNQDILSDSNNDNKIYDGEGNTTGRRSISGNNVTLKNYNFKNLRIDGDYLPGALTWSGNDGKLINCTFEENYGSPGALLVTGSNLTIINCTFKNNHLNAMQFGGAIVWRGDAGRIIDSVFIGTYSANEGGAIYWSAPNAIVINCTFRSNSAWRGGGIQFGNYYKSCDNSQVINSTFISNSDSQGGSAIYVLGASNVTVDGCEFIENGGTYGILRGVSSVTNSVFNNNGGMRSASQLTALISSEYFDNCIFLNNYVKNNCNSIISANTITNCIFLKNKGINCNPIIVSANNLSYNWFGNTYENYTVAPNNVNGLKNWLFLNNTHERLMLLGEQIHVPFVFQIWDGISVSDYDASKVYPMNLELSASNGEINKQYSVVGEDVLFNTSAVGIGTVTAKFFDMELTINLTCKIQTKISVGEPITIYVDQLMNFTGDKFNATLIPFEAGSLIYSTDNVNILKVKNSGFEGINEGTANIVVTFKENNDYASSTASVPVNVIRYDTEITSNNTMSIEYGNSECIDAKMTPHIGNLSYTSDDVNTAVVDEDGRIFAVNSGITTISVRFEGDRKYKPSNKNIIVTINKIDSKIAINDDFKFNFGESDSVSAIVSGVEGIKASVLNHPEAIVEINDNKITVYNLNVGNYTLIASTIPDKNHISANTTAKITVNKANSSLFIPVVKFYKDGSASVNPIMDGAIGITDVKVINHPEAIINIKDNLISISGLAIGDYTLTATTIPDQNHNEVTYSTNVSVVKPDSSIKFTKNIQFDYGGSDSTTVILDGATDIENIKVINHPEAIIEVKNNVISVYGLNAGIYTLSATTVPSENYTAVTGTTLITVNPIDSSIKFTKDIVFEPEGSKFDSFIVEGVVDILVSVINHRDADIYADCDSISLNGLDPGNYLFSITTIPDLNHNSITVEVPFKVNKFNPIVIVKKLTGYTSFSTLSAIIKDNEGNLIDEGFVTFVINGNSYKVPIYNGVAKKNIKLPKARTYTYKATFSSDKSYSKTSSSKIVVKQSMAQVYTKKVTSISGDYFTLKAIVKDSSGKNIDGGIITFTVDGKSYNVNVKNGIATKRLKLSTVKTYTYKTSFSSRYYKSKVSTSNVIVKKQPVFTVKIGKYSVKISYKDYKKIKNLKGRAYLVKTYDTGKTVDYKIYKEVKQVSTKKKLYSWGTYLTYYINNPDAMIAPYGYKHVNTEIKTEDGIEKVYFVYKKTTYKKVLVKTTKSKVYIMVAADYTGSFARIYYRVSEYTDRYGNFKINEYNGKYIKIF